MEAGVSWLKKKHYIRSNVDLQKKIQDKTEKIASLAGSAEEIMEYALRKKRSAPMQYEVLKEAMGGRLHRIQTGVVLEA